MLLRPGRHECDRGPALCREIGAAVLVDDNPGYAVDCASAGLPVLLYDWQLSYAWNRPSPAYVHTSHLLSKHTQWD